VTEQISEHEREQSQRLGELLLDERTLRQEAQFADLWHALGALEKRLDERLVAHEASAQRQFEHAETLVRTIHEASERAINKAEVQQEKRMDSLNEFRAQLKDQQVMLITRSEADARFTAISDTLVDLKDRITRTEGKASGYTAVWGYLVGGGGLLLAAALLIRDVSGPH
jgi:uncharacterized protein YdcH (DUF465 family)